MKELYLDDYEFDVLQAEIWKQYEVNESNDDSDDNEFYKDDPVFIESPHFDDRADSPPSLSSSRPEESFESFSFPNKEMMSASLTVSPSSSSFLSSFKEEHYNERYDGKEDFLLEFQDVSNGKERRTTLMVKNIPNKYSQKMLLQAFEKYKGYYNFFYLPIDFKSRCNIGYAFINFIKPEYIPPFYQQFHNKKWDKFNSQKVCCISFARVQGKDALIEHFSNSRLLVEKRKCRPLIFQSNGVEAGEEEEIPVGPNFPYCQPRYHEKGRRHHNHGSGNGGGHTRNTPPSSYAPVVMYPFVHAPIPASIHTPSTSPRLSFRGGQVPQQPFQFPSTQPRQIPSSNNSNNGNSSNNGGRSGPRSPHSFSYPW